MIHYHVWFSLKPEVSEATGVAAVRAFMAELVAEGSLARGAVLKNTGQPPKSRLPADHALFEFESDEQMSAAFDARRRAGIHAGSHGELVASVGEFVVEVFREP